MILFGLNVNFAYSTLSPGDNLTPIKVYLISFVDIVILPLPPPLCNVTSLINSGVFFHRSFWHYKDAETGCFRILVRNSKAEPIIVVAVRDRNLFTLPWDKSCRISRPCFWVRLDRTTLLIPLDLLLSDSIHSAFGSQFMSRFNFSQSWVHFMSRSPLWKACSNKAKSGPEHLFHFQVADCDQLLRLGERVFRSRFDVVTQHILL